jgi:hypothetical protein
MKRLLIILVVCLPLIGFCQSQNPNDTIPNVLTQLVNAGRIAYKGDTIVNLNSLNNGITKLQISDESKKAIANNGLKLDEKAGVVTLEDIDLLKQDFSFDVKTFANDNEWYENTIKVKVKDGDIRLINVTSDKIEMATGFRKEGKIYVVIAVSLILFFTVIFYLVYLERKTRKLEKQINNK